MRISEAALVLVSAVQRSELLASTVNFGGDDTLAEDTAVYEAPEKLDRAISEEIARRVNDGK